MRRLLLSVLVALSLAMPLAAAVPGTVWAQTRNQVVPPTPETRAAPAPADLNAIPLENWAAIGVGAVLGAVVIDAIGGGTLATVGGVIIGGLFGSWYYEKHYWPF